MQNFTRDIAVARFAAVAVIELLALAVCFLPLLTCPHQWQKDCRKLGTVAAILALAVCLMVLAGATLAPRATYDATVIKYVERGIVSIYLLNVLFLVFVTARTGGPTISLYGTLIPVQLSAMLFMQLQKDKLTNEASTQLATLYVVIALAGYLAAHYLRQRIASWPFLFTTDSEAVDYATQSAGWAAWLTVGAMFLSFVTYAVPSDERFVSQVRSWYGSPTVTAPAGHGSETK